MRAKKHSSALPETSKYLIFTSFRCSYPESCKPGKVTNVQTSFVSYAKRLERNLEWLAPSPSPELDITSYDVICSNVADATDFRTVKVLVGTSATLGDGASANAPFNLDAEYRCTVTATNAAGTSETSDPSAIFVAGSLPKTGPFIVPKSVVPTLGLYDVGENGQWHTGLYCSSCTPQGVSQIISSPYVTGPSSVVNFETPCTDPSPDVAGIRGTFLPSIFNGMLFKDFLAGFKKIEYKYYKVDTSDCQENNAAPAFKLTVFSTKASEAGTTSYTNFVLEPYNVPPVSGGYPPTNSWQTLTVDKTTGAEDEFSANNGWWSTGAFGQDGRGSKSASLAYWESFLNDGSKTTSPSFMDDAVLYQIAIEIGSGNRGLVTYVNDITISSGDYDWSFTFTT